MESKLDRTVQTDAFDSFRSKMSTHMDGFARLLEDMLYRWAVHSDRILSLEKRVDRLESRSS